MPTGQTTIRAHRATIKRLNAKKLHPRETLDDVINRLLDKPKMPTAPGGAPRR